ncbi:hypothetical protein [Clostridium felsineum]|uniref:hypothetical protein n=1 Tax=Clostridium felsineum TaxID=36839 RepID=UPI00396A339B
MNTNYLRNLFNNNTNFINRSNKMYNYSILGTSDEYNLVHDKILFETLTGNLSIEALIS